MGRVAFAGSAVSKIRKQRKLLVVALSCLDTHESPSTSWTHMYVTDRVRPLQLAALQVATVHAPTASRNSTCTYCVELQRHRDRLCNNLTLVEVDAKKEEAPALCGLYRERERKRNIAKHTTSAAVVSVGMHNDVTEKKYRFICRYISLYSVHRRIYTVMYMYWKHILRVRPCHVLAVHLVVQLDIQAYRLM